MRVQLIGDMTFFAILKGLADGQALRERDRGGVHHLRRTDLRPTARLAVPDLVVHLGQAGHRSQRCSGVSEIGGQAEPKPSDRSTRQPGRSPAADASPGRLFEIASDRLSRRDISKRVLAVLATSSLVSQHCSRTRRQRRKLGLESAERGLARVSVEPPGTALSTITSTAIALDRGSVTVPNVVSTLVTCFTMCRGRCGGLDLRPSGPT